MAKQDDSSAEPPNAPPPAIAGMEPTWRPASTAAMQPIQDGPAAPGSVAPIARDATLLAAAAPVLAQRPAIVFRVSHTGSGLAAALFGSQTSDLSDIPDMAAPTVPPPSDYPVSNWDRYEFLELLGRGGMGCVYKARDRRIHRIVALKFIDGAGKRLKERFMQEARTQARIDHPSVCKVLEVGEVEGKAYIAMEFIDGQSLHRAKSLLSIEEKIRLVQQTAEALHAAHELGIIHRDIKPAKMKSVEKSPFAVRSRSEKLRTAV